MPRSALGAGIPVDFVLAPGDMPEALITYARHAAQQRAVVAEPISVGALEGLKTILGLVQRRAKSDFRFYRKNMVLRRIQRGMALLRIDDIAKYIERLRQDTAELEALRRDLLIGVTTFFREPQAFSVLATQALPELVAHASLDSPVRVWVPSCSTGEEAYSIAMLLAQRVALGTEPG
jgi:two-component system, chemotaxis family, CheB/CheR fusion protein